MLAMQSNRYETGQPADWSEGDWNGDLLFDSTDFVVAFQGAKYRTGAYAETTEQPQHQLETLSDADDASVTLYYLEESGDLIVVAGAGFKLTSFHIRSASGRLRAARVENPFDVATESDWFLLVPTGTSVIEYPAALPPGLTREDLTADLLVSGSLDRRGPLGGVGLGDADDPTGYPLSGLLPSGKPPEPSDEPQPNPPIEGLAMGDANADGYLDEADLIHALKSGHYETGAAADWEAGDWSGDGLFNSTDLVALHTTDLYRTGAYRDDAGEPEHQLRPVVGATDAADVTIHYEPSTGDVSVVSHIGRMTSIHIRSSTGPRFSTLSFSPLFTVSEPDELFFLVVEGRDAVRFTGFCLRTCPTRTHSAAC